MSDRRTRLIHLAVENPDLWPAVLPMLNVKQSAGPKAEDRYAANLRDIKTFMRDIEAALKVHEREFKTSGMRDWGFVGDLGHVRELLEETHKFITGTED